MCLLVGLLEFELRCSIFPHYCYYSFFPSHSYVSHVFQHVSPVLSQTSTKKVGRGKFGAMSATRKLNERRKASWEKVFSILCKSTKNPVLYVQEKCTVQKFNLFDRQITVVQYSRSLVSMLIITVVNISFLN